MESSNKIPILVDKIDERNALNAFYNGHLKQMIASKINLIVLKRRNKDEVIGQVPVMLPGVEKPIMRKIVVEQAVAEEQKKYDDNKELVEVIEGLMGELK